MRAEVPHVRWVDLTQRGYIALDLDPARSQAAWFHLADVEDWMAPGGVESFTSASSLQAGERHLTEDASAAAPLPRPPAPAP